MSDWRWTSSDSGICGKATLRQEEQVHAEIQAVEDVRGHYVWVRREAWVRRYVSTSLEETKVQLEAEIIPPLELLAWKTSEEA